MSTTTGSLPLNRLRGTSRGTTRAAAATHGFLAWQQLVPIGLILLVGLGNVVWFLGTPFDWWFEDDPFLYAAIREVDVPWAFFVDPAVHRLGAGPNELAPVLLASMWLDWWIAPRSASWAYLHSALIYLATAVALWRVLGRLLGDGLLAAVTTVAWMLMPSTTVLVEYLSTRHYLIGLFWALLAVLAVDDATRAARGHRFGALARVAVFTALSIVSKEFFPPALLTLVFLWFALRRDWTGAGIAVGLGAAYALYRVWMTEPSISYYGIPLLPLVELPSMLAKLPYTIFGNRFGYLALALTVVLLWRSTRVDRTARRVLLIGLAAVATSLLVLYPVAFSLAETWRSFGPWYRTPCVLNTLLLVGFAYAIGTLRRQSSRALLMTAMLVASLMGLQQTARTWTHLKDLQRAEGQFILASPDRVLISQVHAYWFLDGVRTLYPEGEVAQVLSRWNVSQGEAYRAALASSEAVWRYDGRPVREVDPAQRQELLRVLR